MRGTRIRFNYFCFFFVFRQVRVERIVVSSEVFVQTNSRKSITSMTSRDDEKFKYKSARKAV